MSRRFGAVLAVRRASARFDYGRIHAVIGENGAGKSTLLSLICGSHGVSEGQVLINGQPLVPATAAEAIRRGVGTVHQHFMLVEAFTALENIVLGVEPTRGLMRLDLATGRQRARKVLEELDMQLNLDAKVADLSVGERQNLEIVRVLSRGSKILLLDEPTAVLTPDQATKLFETLETAAKNGACVVVVTHRMHEVLRHCQHVTVMRRGAIVSSRQTDGTNAHELTCDIMGREPLPPVERPELPENPAMALEIKDLHVVSTSGGADALSGFNLQIPRGTIMGLAGVEGNGQHELIGAISGLLASKQGQILLEGQDITHKTIMQRRQRGLSVVHSDRQKEGLMLDLSVADNLVLGDLGQVDEKQAVARRMDQYGIMPPDAHLAVGKLSGGNRQKVVVARALDRSVQAAVLAQPTRGVDLGAARSIHEAICETAKKGAGVLVISADLAELRAICHRIAVLVRGKVTAILPPETSEVDFGHAMLAKEAP